MRETLDELLEECARLHGHLCAGQVLGARMALHGCALIGIEDPRGADRKKLIVWVEIDRCVTDAVAAVTGVRLGRRSLKFMDYGKVAATFYNLETERAVRIHAFDAARELADRLYPHIEERKQRQMRAYREASVEELFKVEAVSVKYTKWDAPGKPLSRAICAKCGEGINDYRQEQGIKGENLCRPCKYGGYYKLASDNDIDLMNHKLKLNQLN